MTPPRCGSARSCRARRRNAAAAARPCSRSWAHWRRRTGRSCGGGKTADGPAPGEVPCSSLLARLGRGILAALARRPAVTVAAMLAPLPIPHAAPLPVAKAETPLVALAVAVDLAHHRGGAILERVDANGQIAQDVLAEPLLPLDLVEGGGRRVDVEHREMGLAVLAQAVGQRLDAPLLGLGDLAAHLLDDAFELRGQFLDLLRARVWARQENLFVERHADAFPLSAMLLPARSPSSL